MMDARATRESTRDKWDLGEVTETHGSETGHLLGGIGQHFKLTGSLLYVQWVTSECPVIQA